jgi:hypothetical protein
MNELSFYEGYLEGKRRQEEIAKKAVRGNVAERITKIRNARVTTYHNGQVEAHVDWEDHKGFVGTTSGHPDSAHMRALLGRAEREGIKIKR